MVYRLTPIACLFLSYFFALVSMDHKAHYAPVDSTSLSINENNNQAPRKSRCNWLCDQLCYTQDPTNVNRRILCCKSREGQTLLLGAAWGVFWGFIGYTIRASEKKC